MEVWCGMIMGFDNDDDGIFDRQIQFIQEARIAFSMSGMLSAIPKTPLHERLAADGRLDLADVSEYGTNVVPLLMSREELLDGYLRVLNELYEPEAYFERTEALFLQPSFDIGIKKKRNWLGTRDRSAQELLFLFKGIGLFAPADDPRRRVAPPARVPQAALAVPEGPPPARPGPLLLVPHDHALPCPVPGETDGQREMQLVNSF